MKESTKAKIDAMEIHELQWHLDNEHDSEFRVKEKRKYISEVLSEKKSAEEASNIDKLASSISTKSPERWDNKPIGKIGISIAGIFIASCLAYIVYQKFGIPL